MPHPEKIAVIAAMGEELAPILAQLHPTRHLKKKFIEIWQAQLAGQSALIALIGIGKVNAALAMQYLIDHYQLAQVYQIGVAGATQPGIQIGDVVLGDNFIESDFDTTLFGYQPGQIPRLDQWVFPGKINPAHFQHLAADTTQFKLHQGTIVSADQFVTDRDQVLAVGEQFQASAKDMESAAVAHVCSVNSLPLTVIRGISDNSGSEAVEEYRANLDLAIEHSCQIFWQLLALDFPAGKT